MWTGASTCGGYRAILGGGLSFVSAGFPGVCSPRAKWGKVCCFRTGRGLPKDEVMPSHSDMLATASSQGRDLNAVIVDTSASLIIVVDVGGRIVRFNPACQRATGYALADAIGRVFWEFLLDPADA